MDKYSPDKGSLEHRIYSVRFTTEEWLVENPYHKKPLHGFLSLSVIHSVPYKPWRFLIEPVRIMIYPPSSGAPTYYAAVEIRDMYNTVCLSGNGSDNGPYPMCLAAAVQKAYVNAQATVVNRYHFRAWLQTLDDVEQSMFAVARALFLRGVRSDNTHHVIRTI